MKFEIPDGPRVKGFDEIVKRLMAGATLPKLTRPEPTPAELVARGPIRDKGFQALADALTDVLECETAETIRRITGMRPERCEEIIKIRNVFI
jgi:hypothetical protein